MYKLNHHRADKFPLHITVSPSFGSSCCLSQELIHLTSGSRCPHDSLCLHCCNAFSSGTESSFFWWTHPWECSIPRNCKGQPGGLLIAVFFFFLCFLGRHWNERKLILRARTVLWSMLWSSVDVPPAKGKGTLEGRDENESKQPQKVKLGDRIQPTTSFPWLCG